MADRFFFLRHRTGFDFQDIVKKAFVVLLLVSGSKAGFAEPIDLNRGFRSFSLYVENDVFADSDDQYTSGLKLTWSQYGLSELPADAWTHRWLYPVVRRLGFGNLGNQSAALTFSVGQAIYTPEDIESRELIRDDRPYAGITYAAMNFHRKTRKRMHSFGLCAGIVGPHSYAEQMQTFSHDFLNSHATNGWDHQLEDEPVICLIYDYKRKVLRTNPGSGIGGEAIFHTGGGLGNVRTFYNLGMLLRYGWNVPTDFGNFPIQPATCFNGDMCAHSGESAKKRFGIHLFLSGCSQVVFHDIFLDGNTFRDSHSVDKEPVVGIFTGGLGLAYGKVKLILAYVCRTKSFKKQKDPEIFGSVHLSFHY